jgi:hypothetical protein
MIGSGNGEAGRKCRIGTILCRDNMRTEQRRNATEDNGQNLHLDTALGLDMRR